MSRRPKSLNDSITNSAIVKRQFIIAIVLLMSISSLLLSILLALEKPKIGFVRSQELVYSYLGMKEAHNRYSEKLRQWQVNKDTLDRIFLVRE